MHKNKMPRARKLLATVAVAAVVATGLAANASAEDGVDSEHRCLAEALYYEARDQGIVGMVAVAAVVKNRVKSDRYPDSVCEVVRQAQTWAGNPVRDRCQFSFFCDGLPERPAEKEAWATALRISEALLNTDFEMRGLEDATHYHATSVQPSWSMVLEPCGQVGDHVFYSLR